jgi:hypothetical protein
MVSHLEPKVQFLIAKIKNFVKISEPSGLKTAHLEINLKSTNSSQSENKNNFCRNSKHYETMKLIFLFNPSSGRIIILTLSGSETTCDYPAASGVMHNY